jgi:SAM-dependent methyltransferase
MTAIAAPPIDGYEPLARVYDAFTAASDYEAWTTHVLALAAGYGWRGSEVLDVACGTGKSFMPLVERGFRVTGCDVSAAMLAEAARKAPEVPLIEADMRSLPRLGAFEMVVCFDDSLNHLLDENDLASAFASVARNLAPADGMFLFDLNSLLAYRTTFVAHSVSEQDGLIFVLRGDSTPDAAPGCRAAAHVDAFRPCDDGRYERTTARLVQRHFPPHRVTALLSGAGLDCLGVHGVLADGSHVSEPDESRQLKLMYVARLAKGGDPRDDQEA